MTFTPTPELTREMIQYGKALTHLTHQEYQSMMIEKFYPNADTEVVDQMVEWSKYPTLNLINLKELKDIELQLYRSMKSWISLVDMYSVDVKIPAKHPLNFIPDADYFGATGAEGSSCSDNHYTDDLNWDTLVSLINCDKKAGFVKKELDDNGCNFSEVQRIYSYVTFVNIMQSIWSAHKPNQSKLELQVEVDLLMQQNAELRYQLQLNTYNLERLMPTNPVYNYDEIKSRKQKLHSEFKRVAKLMKLMKLG